MTEQAAEADALEQQQPPTGRHLATDRPTMGVEASEADTAEQSRPVASAEPEALEPLRDDVDEGDYAEQTRVVPDDEEDEYR